MKSPIKVALVGAGFIADVHLRYLQGLTDVEVVAIADLDSQRVAATATKWRIPRTYTAVADMLKEARPDSVHILTPPHTHHRVAMAVLDVGCHALVEKPMAMSVAECDAMIARAAARGVVLGVVHNELFDPTVVELRRLIESGEFGAVFHVDALRGTAFPQGGQSVPWAHQAPVNLLYDIGPHPVYLARAILGKIRTVNASARETFVGANPVYNDWRVLMSCERGTATLAVSTAATPVQSHITVFGTLGTIHADLMRMYLLTRRPSRLPSAIARGLSSFQEAAQMIVQTGVGSFNFAMGRLRPYQGLGHLLAQFYSALSAGDLPPVTGKDGRDVVVALDLIAAEMGVLQ